MKAIFSGIFILSLLMMTPAMADKTMVTASNGVQVHVKIDEFNEKSEYTSQEIGFGNDVITSWNRSFFLVAVHKKSGASATDLFVQGAAVYKDDWHNYDTATYRGGDPVDIDFGPHDVLSCAGGGKCLLAEMFTIRFKDNDIEKHTRNGTVDIKLGSSSTSQEPILKIPVEVIDAVREVANR